MNCAMTEDERIFELYNITGYKLVSGNTTDRPTDLCLDQRAESDNRDNCGAKD